MTLFKSSETCLTYHQVSDILHLSYSAARLSVSFSGVYQRVLDSMLENNVGKLLLDLKRNAPPADDEAELLVQPLSSAMSAHPDRPLFIAAVVSEKQYEYQVANLLASSAATLPPAQVEFNYFTSHHEATDWLNAN